LIPEIVRFLRPNHDLPGAKALSLTFDVGTSEVITGDLK
jgi:hypothetical protein